MVYRKALALATYVVPAVGHVKAVTIVALGMSMSMVPVDDVRLGFGRLPSTASGRILNHGDDLDVE